MTESSNLLLHGWRYGIHPNAVGLQVRAIGRVELPLGEALRLELGDVEPEGSDTAHIQYYILTEAGPWALWLSCPQAERATREAALEHLVPPMIDAP